MLQLTNDNNISYLISKLYAYMNESAAVFFEHPFPIVELLSIFVQCFEC